MIIRAGFDYKFSWRSSSFRFQILISYSQVIIEIEEYMQKQREVLPIFEEMFSDDQTIRLSAIAKLSDTVSILSLKVVQDEVIPFLQEFLLEDPETLQAILLQIRKMGAFFKDKFFHKELIELLLKFCNLDEREVGISAVQLIIQFSDELSGNYIMNIKQLIQSPMRVSKQCALQLILDRIGKVLHEEKELVRIFKVIITDERASVRILAAKRLMEFSKRLTSKEDMLDILQAIYSDSEELPKLIALGALISFYPFNPELVLTNLKILVQMRKWRYNFKLCEHAEELAQFLNITQYKQIIEKTFLEMLKSQDLQIRAQACCTFNSIAKKCSKKQRQEKLLPIFYKLSNQKSIQFKIIFSKYIIRVFPYFSADVIKNKLIPLVFEQLKTKNIEISKNIIENFALLAYEVQDRAKIQEIVIKPLKNQFYSQNWRLKVQLLNSLGSLVLRQNFLTTSLIDLLMNSCLDRVEALRNAATLIIIDIINKNDSWIKQYIMPKLLKMRKHKNYQFRQKLLMIIGGTVEKMDDEMVSRYKLALNEMLKDRIANVRLMALKTSLSNKKLIDYIVISSMSKLKRDQDEQVRETAKQIPI